MSLPVTGHSLLDEVPTSIYGSSGADSLDGSGPRSAPGPVTAVAMPVVPISLEQAAVTSDPFSYVNVSPIEDVKSERGNSIF